MEHVLENRFLNKEMAQKAAFQEVDDKLQAVEQDQSQAEFQVYESFVKEKHTLLGYVQDLVLFSAKKHEIDTNELYPFDDAFKQESKPKQEGDLLQVKNRVIIIVSYLS